MSTIEDECVQHSIHQENVMTDVLPKTGGTAGSPSDKTLIRMRLVSIAYAARDINLYRFEPLEGRPLPSFEPGAHVDIHLPNGMMRQYSLALPYQGGSAYVVGVKRDPASRGGSQYMHDTLRVGAEMDVGAPRNHFGLAADAAHSVMIAGGIGITPIYCMVRELAAAGRTCEIHYAVRRREDAAFLREIEALGLPLKLYVSSESPAGRLDVSAVMSGAEQGSHFYCCGPSKLNAAFVGAGVDVPPDRLHWEHFVGVAPAAATQVFTVRLVRSKRDIPVQPGQSIAQTLIANGVDVELSCEQGVCGVCETCVLSGRPDHRDLILTDDEKRSNTVMMICCSGSHDPLLELDL